MSVLQSLSDWWDSLIGILPSALWDSTLEHWNYGLMMKYAFLSILIILVVMFVFSFMKNLIKRR